MEVALGDRVIAPGDHPDQWRCLACEAPAPSPLPVQADAAAPSEPVAVHAAPPLSTPSEPDSGIDECEVLLRRAIEMVRAATREAQAMTDPAAGGAAAAPGAPGAPQLHCASPASILPETDDGPDECEVLLGRAIEMVRSPVHRALPRRGIADDGPQVPGDLAKPMPAESSATRVVQIDHDQQEAEYVARDVRSGLSVLRHQDAARLRTMCERIGWQVAESGPPKSDA